jgi:chromate transporter
MRQRGTQEGSWCGTDRWLGPTKANDRAYRRNVVTHVAASGGSAADPRPSNPHAGVGEERAVAFGDAVRVWVRVAASSFGGPAGQIAVLHRLVVEEKRWIGERRFLHALNFVMLLPGPEAQQLATYLGWLLHGVRGGLVAGGLFVLPGFLTILALSIVYAVYGDVRFVEALFYGLKPAVVVIVVEALLRIGRRALPRRAMGVLAALAFVAIFFLEVPFPLIVLIAAAAGWVVGRWRPLALEESGGKSNEVPSEAAPEAEGWRVVPSWQGALRTATLWLTVWWVPVIALVLVAGTSSVLVTQAVFFSKVAVVTFGGAYSVLAYVAQQAVDTYGWVQASEMLDGLGMAETTPGPLIQVVQFVGFLGAYRNPGGLDPLVAGVLASVVTTWVVFVPCFMFVFVGAPWVEHLRGNTSLRTALSGVAAAVVGVILNLAVWFALHVLFGEVSEMHAAGVRVLIPRPSTLDWGAVAIVAGAALTMFRLKVGMLPTLAGAAAAGVLLHVLGAGPR